MHQINDPEQLKKDILTLTEQYHAAAFPKEMFEAGETLIPVSGKVFDSAELVNLVESSLEFWLTTGRYAAMLERELARFLGVRFSFLCNSGSSANLLALSSLTSPKLGDRRLKPGDEVITVASGFPTTINPIFQNQLTPVFIDVDLDTLNADVECLEAALSPKTRAIFMAHTLGNPFDLCAVKKFAESHHLWLIEDNCDALGSLYDGKLTGSFGDISTLSMYPAHHITTGEGGSVFTSNNELKPLIESFREWGRDCWCEPGVDNTCGRRFDYQLGDLPYGYDHKYIYSHVGYNLKMTDMQAAIGLGQMNKLHSFTQQRRSNFDYLSHGLSELNDFLKVHTPTVRSEPSWFGFPITLREDAPFLRSDIIDFLESKKIATRLLFGGNLIKQPAYADLPFRIVDDIPNSDRIMTDTFWIGLYPGISGDMLEYVVDSFWEFIKH